jgi:peptidyl-lysine (3S)-dioxygenase / protease
MRLIESLNRQLAEDIASYEHTNQCVELHDVPDAVTFFRDYVSLNRPVVVRGAAVDWPAMSWSLDSLNEAVGSCPVHVTITPDGRADAVKTVGAQGCKEPGDALAFVLPHAEVMPFASFVQLFRRTRHQHSGAVPTVQFQNDNWGEFATDGSIAADVRWSDLAWAQEAFGRAAPDATNIWIGDSRSSTTFHKVRSTSHSSVQLHQLASMAWHFFKVYARQWEYSGCMPV